MYISHGVEFNQNQSLVIVQGRGESITEQDVEEADDMLKPFGLDVYNQKQFKELPQGFDGFYAIVKLTKGKEIHNEYPGSSVVVVDMPGDYGVQEK